MTTKNPPTNSGSFLSRKLSPFTPLSHRRCNLIKNNLNYNWIEIRKDYELHSLSYKKLSRIHGPHPKTIAYHSKKENWVKGGMVHDAAIKTREYLAKSGAQINTEYDGYYEELTGKIAKSIKEEELNPADVSFHAGSLKTIRQERLDIRGELTPLQERKHQLDVKKFEHKEHVDLENLKIKKRVKSNGDGDEDLDSEFID